MVEENQERVYTPITHARADELGFSERQFAFLASVDETISRASKGLAKGERTTSTGNWGGFVRKP